MPESAHSFLLRFLELVQEAVPSPSTSRPAIMLFRGESKQLGLQLNINGKFSVLFLEEKDLQSPQTPEQLVAEILSLIKPSAE